MTTGRFFLTAAALTAAGLGATTAAHAGQDAYLGEITPVAFTYCPRGTTELNGQLLAISTNQALFSLLGTTYGGVGRTSFKLPDLRGRVPMHLGQGPGLSNRPLGQSSGSETNTMTVQQMPAHNHSAGIQTVPSTADSTNPRNDAFAVANANVYSDTGAPSGNFMHADTVLVQNTGGNQQQNNMQPYQVIRYCIALTGVFPSRN